MQNASAVQQAIDKADAILVIAHVNPDGDALGSLTAVGQMLRQKGKKVSLLCDDRVPSRFRYMGMSDEVQRSHNKNSHYDLVIAVDCGDEQRMGKAFANLPDPQNTPLINIDHHITNTMFGQINLVDAEATSTAEILYNLFQELSITINDNIAMSLLTGIVTDTLGFRTVGVESKTMHIAGKLMEAGADLALITQQGLNLKPLATLRLWQIGLDNLKLENGLIWTSITKEELKKSGHTSPSSSGLVNMMANVEQVAMSAVLMEMADETVRVGFRCHPPYSVSELALNLGGGGHPLAAGCTLPGPLDKAESLVVDMCKETIRRQTRMAQNGNE